VRSTWGLSTVVNMRPSSRRSGLSRRTGHHHGGDVAPVGPQGRGRLRAAAALKAYFDANFVQLKSPWKRATLYKRKGFDLRRAPSASRSR